MTSINLNPQLGARLKAIQEAWGHDNPSESLATILDSQVFGWTLPLPQATDVSTGSAYRVRLKARHVEYFTQMAQFAGCQVPDLARSFLVKWLCERQPTTLAPMDTQRLPKATQKKQCKPTQKAQRQKQVKEREMLSTPEQTNERNGRAMLKGLIK